MNLREVEGYRPIPRGGLKLLLAYLPPIILFCLAPVLIWFGHDSSIAMGLASGSTALMWTLLGWGLRGQSPTWWLRDYWRRNVRGYEACFWIDKDEGVDPDVSIWVEEMRRPPYWASCELNGRGKIFLRVPLGGWFRKQGQLYSIRAAGESSERMPFRAWRVIVRKPIVSPFVGACIEVVDGKGDRVPLTVSETLRFAAWISAGGIQEWQHEVPDLLRAVRESRADCAEVTCQRDEVKKRAEELEGKWKTACRQREDALSAIAEAIGRIDATKRFIKSAQAVEIRKWLNGRLAAMAPVGAPGTVFGARETLTQPAACEIVGFGR